MKYIDFMLCGFVGIIGVGVLFQNGGVSLSVALFLIIISYCSVRELWVLNKIKDNK